MKPTNIRKLERAHTSLLMSEKLLSEAYEKLYESDNADRHGRNDKPVWEIVKDMYLNVRYEEEWLAKLIKVMKEDCR